MSSTLPSARELSIDEKRELLRRRLAARGRTAPASFAQERLWFLHQMEPDSPAYNISAAWRLAGPLDARALTRAVEGLIHRHEALRTTLAPRDGAPVQVIAPAEGGAALETVDLGGLPAAERADAARRLAEEEAHRPFDLERGPLFRPRLLRLAADDHVLVLTLHHAMGDGWSLGVLYRDLSALYAAALRGEPSPLPEPPIQYADYAAWQRGTLSGPALEGQLAYWRGRLADAPPMLELPADRPRPAAQSFHGAQEPLALPPALMAPLAELARREGATPFMALLAGWQAVLARWSGQDDVVVGTAVAGRDQAETEELVGFFANTLALRGNLSGQPGFRALLARVRRETLGAFAHAEAPFERVVEELRPERSPGCHPVFQVMFTLAPPAPGPALEGLQAHRLEVERWITKFDLSVELAAEADGGVAGWVRFGTQLFDAETVRRLAAHLRRLLEAAVAQPDRPVAELPLLDEAERRTLEAWGCGARASRERPRQVDGGATIHALFSRRAAATPDAAAVTFAGKTLTYARLDARSDALARRLVSAGVRAGDRVGLALERSLEVPAAILAVLKAGASYVPLDSAYPPERLAGMMEDAAIRVLLVRDAVPDSLAGFAGRVVTLAEDAVDADADLSHAGTRALTHLPAVTAESEAYVMFTSGSTGRPNGVAVPHRAVVRLVRDTDFAELGPEQVFLQLAPLAFDASTLELWGPLLNGGRLVVHPPQTPTLDELGALLRAEGVTTLWLTAGLFHQVVDGQLDALAGVRQLVAGGDVLSPPHVGRVLERFPALRLVNGYGPTENTTFTCCHDVRAEDVARGSIPIGRPIAGTRVHVLDAALRPVPVGVPGELCAAGDGLALGYVGRPELTAERFVEARVHGRAERVYRTGDRVRWRNDGTIEFLGRADAQVKIRGFRIEPGEVEAALLAVGGVRQAAVVARPDPAGGRRLVAYVVGDGMPAPGELRGMLRRTLPEYMVPAFVVPVDALPLTPNGKVDRRALPDPDLAEAAEAYVAPRTPTEAVLAEIWAQVMGLERVGIDDDFFALGGHSLLAMHVWAHLKDRRGTTLPLRALFEHPTVRAVAAAVDAAPRAEAADAETRIVPSPRTATRIEVDGRDVEAFAAPASFSQQRLWMLDQMEAGRATYAVPVALRIRGALDAGALRRALDALVERHESLRTIFRDTDAGPMQVVLARGAFPVESIDLTPLDADAREAELRRRLADEVGRPFGLAAGPLARASLYRLAGDEHVLLLNLHHVVTDGWSNGVLLRELAALYGAFAEGGPPPLAAPALQYPDWSQWQRERLRGAAYDAHRAYWTSALADAPALLELPADRPRPATWEGSGAAETFRLSREMADAVEALARAEGCTPFMVLLAAFQALLGRYARQDDVVVGTPVANRTRPETRDVVGFFVNTLALRGDLSGDPTFRALLHRVRDVALGAFAHQEMPFERLVDELKVPRSTAHAPVFQVMFILQTAGDGDAALPGLRVERMRVVGTYAPFDLTLALHPRADGMDGALEYATALFDRETALRLIAHFRTLLTAACAAPDATLSTLPLLTADEMDASLRAWEGPALEPTFAPSRSRTFAPVHERIAAQAARTPDAIAVEGAGARLTYARLEDRAGRLAHRLRARGVRPGVIAAVRAERSVEAVVAILAVLKAGGAYLPLDPALPAERQAYMLADSHAALLLDATGAPAPPGYTGAVAELAAELDACREPPAVPCSLFPVPRSSEDLAYVIYTSGSTGRPKGVAIPHRALGAYVDSARQAYDMTPADRFLQFAPLSFDSSVEELFAPLAAGATMVLRDEEMLSVDGFWRAAERLRLTIGSLPTAFWHEVAAAMERARPPIPHSLRIMIIGGERALPERVAQWRRGVGDRVRLINSYGPTETTVAATLHDVAADGDTVPIGRPMPGYRVRVLDASLRPVPIGIPGELFVGGIGVARGYLGRPALTAERFVPDPFAPTPGERLYRTGDLVRWTESTHALTHSRTHALEFLGRTDDQVKVRGFRIEPREIEGVLRAHPAVLNAAVAVRGGGAARLVAWLVPAEGASPPSADLAAFVRERLPEYMVPAAFVAIDRFPLTPSGKIDRNALPDPDWAEAAEAYVAPRTPAEAALAAIWAEVLGLDRVGARDDFFALGGHSLLATRVVSYVRRALGVELPLRAVFEHVTLERLARQVERLRASVVLPSIEPADRDRPIPLSFAQQRLWFLDQLQPGGTVYNLPAALRLTGALDAAALERALAEVVRRHEVLRTVLAAGEAEPRQVILPAGGFRLSVEPVAGEEGVAAALRGEAARPFDLARGPLFRARLLRVAERDHVLLLCMHHAVSDGWSIGVLYRELSALYAAFTRGEPSPLAPLPVQYADYAVWQRAYLARGEMERQLAWWRERLAGAPARLELPADLPRPAVRDSRGARERVVLPPELLAGLHALARGEGATLFMALLAAFQLVLSRWSGQDDVVVGTPIAGRTRAEVEGLIGFFINTLALRTDVSGDPTPRELLRRVRQTTLDAYAHQELPFEKLVEELSPDRALGHTPVFQVLFTLQNAGPAELRLPGVDAAPLADVAEHTKFDLQLFAQEREDGLVLVLQYATDLFLPETVRRMLDHLHALLQSFASDADQRASRVPLLSDAERAQLAAWSAADADPPSWTVVDRFQAWAARTPDAPAIVCEARTLTYAQANAAANRLAHYLRGLGATTESRVGICLERGVDAIVALLGVMKAGAAWVATDPAWPAERIAGTVADAGVSILLTTRTLADAAGDHPARLVLLDDDADRLAAQPAHDPESVPAPEHLAYVIYTSGSTGRPKGVMIEHRQLASYVAGVLARLDLPEGASYATVTTLSADLGHTSVFPALCTGGALHVVTHERGADAEAFARLMRRAPVDVLKITPSHLAALLTASDPAAVLPRRRLVLGGEASRAEWIESIRRIAPDLRILNHYGPTETTVGVLTHGVDPVTPSLHHSITPSLPLGRPLPGTRVYVLDAHGAEQPAGAPGELYVGGAGVGRGYLSRPAMTAERFVPDPFAPAAGARMYRTGDRARWTEVRACESAKVRKRDDSHGEDDSRADAVTLALSHSRTFALEFLGRADDQVKIRGFRVEPGEVAAVLARHPAVREAAVLARTEDGEPRLVAYVVPADDETPRESELREWLQRRVPEYMLPSAFVALDALPLTANGKLDRRALPAPDWSGGADAYVAPRTATERAMASVWEELLGVERVGVHDNFFARGGHSLRAARLASRVRVVFGVELPLRAVFEHGTVERLAREVERLQASGAAAALPAIRPRAQRRPAAT